MKLYTDLDIVNGLSTCRDMFEAKAYLKANNIAISDQELELLQSQCNKINSERTLTIRQLNNVAGGMYGVEARRPEAPQYNGGTFGGRGTHRTRAVRPELAQYRIDTNSEAGKKFEQSRYDISTGIAMQYGSVEAVFKSALYPRNGRNSAITVDEALYAARAFDTRTECDRKKIAALTAEVESYKKIFGELPVSASTPNGELPVSVSVPNIVDDAIPGTPPDILCTPPGSP